MARTATRKAKSATRTLDGIEFPSPGTWTVDPGHAEIGFVGRHFGLTKVRGRFTGVTGSVVIADDPRASRIEVSIETATVNSGDESRDEHLRSADLFDVAEHPTATFTSTGINHDGATGTITGDLTIKGVTRPVILDVNYLGSAVDPWGNDRSVFSASTKIDRYAWGITWNMPLDTGGLLVSKLITIEMVELIREP